MSIAGLYYIRRELPKDTLLRKVIVRILELFYLGDLYFLLGERDHRFRGYMMSVWGLSSWFNSIYSFQHYKKSATIEIVFALRYYLVCYADHQNPGETWYQGLAFTYLPYLYVQIYLVKNLCFFIAHIIFWLSESGTQTKSGK
jgi:hypothetical protein